VCKTRAGCEWVQVDFETRLMPFYFDTCGFRVRARAELNISTTAIIGRG
jgi:hypothetical protein